MTLPELDHERVVAAIGPRSGLPMTVAVHSTVLGVALGGCRVWAYDRWQDGLADALRLSSAMTLKCAVAGLSTGGGKSVIVAPRDGMSAGLREAALRDLGEIVESLGGSYRTAEDVGTSSADMLVVKEMTDHVVGLPLDQGGVGEPAIPTARGVYSALRSTARYLELDMSELRVTISGLGQVGSRLAAQLADDGARLILSDINPSRRAFADELGAEWASVDSVFGLPADIVVPAGIGGVLTTEVIESLDCRGVVGPANNQLADMGSDQHLAAKGILWAPDFVVNAGGALAAILTEVERLDDAVVETRIDGIGSTLTGLYETAQSDGITPLRAALRLAATRLAPAA